MKHFLLAESAVVGRPFNKPSDIVIFFLCRGQISNKRQSKEYVSNSQLKQFNFPLRRFLQPAEIAADSGYNSSKFRVFT